ncbi:MAG: hypothetical protein JWM77_651 [Rhodospirillales bacterium]|nr:hypothetical protein [Rhodospirillales bacterium]
MDTCPFVEYRRYTLHPGRRDELIELFDREFVETQEAEQMHLLGQFRVLDQPDRFVWLRGFADMTARGKGLAAFYGGPAWRANRTKANATMLDSDDVFLLRPSAPQYGFTRDGRERAPRGATEMPAGLFLAMTWFLAPGGTTGFAAQFEGKILPALLDSGAELLATYCTSREENNFPALPVRDEEVFVAFAAVDDAASRPAIEAVLAPHCDAGTELWWLTPTARSALRRSA